MRSLLRGQGIPIRVDLTKFDIQKFVIPKPPLILKDSATSNRTRLAIRPTLKGVFAMLTNQLNDI